MTTAQTVAIVGASESTDLGRIPGVSSLELHADSALNALADAGLTAADIDGIAAVGEWAVHVGHYLGILPRYVDGTDVGGASFMFHVRHASAAIRAGYADAVLVVHGQSGRSGIGETYSRTAPFSIRGQFERPFGVVNAAPMYALGLRRYMATYGLTPEQLASVPVAQRQWASRTTRALRREPLTVEDVLSSPYIAEPLHKPECCLVTDGGGAVVVMSYERASALGLDARAVCVLGTGEAVEAPTAAAMADPTSPATFRIAGGSAFAEAELTPADIDHVMIYDAFAHLPLYGLEELGFVPRGEAGQFIADGNTAPGGRLPLNTNGGGLSYTHTGRYGMFAILESVRQVRGEAEAQVPGVEISLAHGVGGQFTSSGTLILGRSEAAAKAGRDQ